MEIKKCLVLDLDNTLWGGLVGEDGFNGIQLSLTPPGSAFMAFQQALLDLYHRGVILAINSRNNYEETTQVIRSHPNMVLKEHHFAAMRINWKDKAENLIDLAKELNIGLDSMVFLDDDPVNRHLVKTVLPEIETPDLPANPVHYAKFLLSLPYFSSTAITDEDKMRGNLYVTERLRREAEKSFDKRGDFLKNLGLELMIFTDDASSVARLAQLMEKTNQFNTNKQPLAEEEIISLISSPSHKVFHGQLLDRFGDYGITNLAIVENKNAEWHIKHFLMSCRVIGRGAEEAFLSFIARAAQDRQAEQLSIEFFPTEKNRPAEEFVKKYFHHKTAPVKSLAKPPAWIKIVHGREI